MHHYILLPICINNRRLSQRRKKQRARNSCTNNSAFVLFCMPMTRTTCCWLFTAMCIPLLFRCCFLIRDTRGEIFSRFVQKFITERYLAIGLLHCNFIDSDQYLEISVQFVREERTMKLIY